MSPTKCQSNIKYLTSVINLIGSLLKHNELLNNSFIEAAMKIFSSTLQLFKDKCGKSESCESCVSLIANAVADSCSDDNPNFTKVCLNYCLPNFFIEIFNNENPWNLKINLFEVILKLFSYGLPNVEILNAFLNLGFADLFLYNLDEMCSCNGFAITLTLKSILTFLSKANVNENTALVNIILSDEVEEALKVLIQSDDSEIKYDSERIEFIIRSIYQNNDS